MTKIGTCTSFECKISRSDHAADGIGRGAQHIANQPCSSFFCCETSISFGLAYPPAFEPDAEGARRSLRTASSPLMPRACGEAAAEHVSMSRWAKKWRAVSTRPELEARRSGGEGKAGRERVEVSVKIVSEDPGGR